MGFFGSSDDKEETIGDLNKDLQEKEREIKKLEGKRRTEALKKQKREELKKKKKQLKSEKFKQNKAGKIIDTLGSELGKLAEATDSERAEQLSQAAEKVDGDGRNDSKSALGIGLEDSSKARDIEVEGDLQVEGDVVTEENDDDGLTLTTDEDDGSGGIF
jgi:hypothetical protein